MSTYSDWLREYATEMESCCDADKTGQMHDDAQKCKAAADALDAAEKYIREKPHHYTCRILLDCEPVESKCNCGKREALEHFND